LNIESKMVITHISQLTPVSQRAIIINHNTKALTLLALLSALRYANVPVLLIDCASTDGSFDFFKSSMGKYDFDLMSAPLKKHGRTLDSVFSLIKDEKVLLIDSDIEILDYEIISFLNRHINEPNVFASGFLNGPAWLTDKNFQGTSFENALYHERPFMPVVLWKVQYVKEALQAGYSFADKMVNNEFAQLPPGLSGIARRFFRLIHKESPHIFRKRYFLSYPKSIFYDTGANIYEYLRYERFLSFVNLPEPCHIKYITHFWGATRNAINANDNHTGEMIKSNTLKDMVRQRLKVTYNEVI
jgi:hypothetical protein